MEIETWQSLIITTTTFSSKIRLKTATKVPNVLIVNYIMFIELERQGVWLTKTSSPKTLIFYYKADQRDNRTITTQKLKWRNCYQPDSNILVYISDLMDGKVHNQFLFKELVKLLFLVSKDENDVNPFFAAWELASPKDSFPNGQVNRAMAEKYLLAILKGQCLALLPLAIDYSIVLDPFKVSGVLKKYCAKTLLEAASVLYDRLFPVLTGGLAGAINQRVEQHKKYLELCHLTHRAHLDNGLKGKRKLAYFVDELLHHDLPLIPKTYYLCCRILSDKIPKKGYDCIRPEKRYSTAVDLFFSDFAHMANRVNADDVENRNIFVTSDRISYLGEDTETVIMQFGDEQLRGDFLDPGFLVDDGDQTAFMKFWRGYKSNL